MERFHYSAFLLVSKNCVILTKYVYWKVTKVRITKAIVPGKHNSRILNLAFIRKLRVKAVK